MDGGQAGVFGCEGACATRPEVKRSEYDSVSSSGTASEKWHDSTFGATYISDRTTVRAGYTPVTLNHADDWFCEADAPGRGGGAYRRAGVGARAGAA